MLITATGVPMVKTILIFIGDQKQCWYVQGIVSVLFILRIVTCFISRILLAKIFDPLSERLDIFKDYIKLKLFIFKYDILNLNLYSVASMVGSTFSLLLDGRTKVIAFASKPLGR